MRYLGNKVVQLDTVKLPTGFAKRKKEPHVVELAASIKRGGLTNLPTVRVLKGVRYLGSGGDRFAALMLNKVTKHEVRLFEATDEEFRIHVLEENLRRRRNDDYDAMTRELVELTGEQIEERRAEEPAELPATVTGNSDEAEPPRKVGRPKSAKGEAREIVAAATGRTPEAVRQAEKRAKAEDKAKEEAPGPSAPMPPPVDTFDLELAEPVVRDWFASVRAVQETLRDAGRKVDGALRAITANLKNGDSIQQAAHVRTWQAVHEAADAIRRATPDSVCPWCKCQLNRVATCTGCSSTGFVSMDSIDQIAPELMERGADAKVPNGSGGFELLSGAKGKPEKAKPAKGARKLRVENEFGEDITPDEVIERADDMDTLF